MAVMTISEARAALPDVVNRVAEGEEVTITRHGRATAVMVRPDIVWSEQWTDQILRDDARLIAVLRERRRCTDSRSRRNSTRSLRRPRGEIYGDEGR
jgi:antitoxin (DNA-binding transcriptional repressor) of toxin-antitoxin stability system